MTRTTRIYFETRRKKRSRYLFSGNQVKAGKSTLTKIDDARRRRNENQLSVNSLLYAGVVVLLILVGLAVFAGGLGSSGPVLAVVFAGIPVIVITAYIASQIA